jgi:hypothetical protein
VFFEVREDVNEGVSNCSRRREGTTVPSVRNEPSTPKQQPVYLPRQADIEAAHAAKQSPAVRSFHDQMKMIRLHREVDDSKSLPASPIRTCDHVPDGGKNELPPQRPEQQTHRDVHRLSRAMRRASAVRHALTPHRGLPASPAAPTAPRILERQSELTFANAGHIHPHGLKQLT